MAKTYKMRNVTLYRVLDIKNYNFIKYLILDLKNIQRATILQKFSFQQVIKFF